MKFATVFTDILLLSSTLISSTVAIKPRQNSYTPAVGVQNGSAMQAWQAMPQTDKMSFYQLSGIHGLPAVAWDGVTGPAKAASAWNASPDRSGYNTGYCTHSMTIFLPWHRPYLALVEQQLNSLAMTIAQKYTGPDKQLWIVAAKKLRLPYWDWAQARVAGDSSFPVIMGSSQISVQTPTGWKSIPNPLFKYTFNDVPGANHKTELQMYPETSWADTKRNPSGQAVISTSQNNVVVSNCHNNIPDWGSTVYNLFTNSIPFNIFGTALRPAGSTATSLNIEDPHDNVHVVVGGRNANTGHMSFPAVAAFDPVFWLHHAFVDRLFTVQQKLYPGNQLVDQVQRSTTYMSQDSETIGNETPLYPFRKNSAGDFWKAGDVYDETQFNYYYADVRPQDSSNTIRSMLYNKYGGGSAAARRRKRDVSSTNGTDAIEYQYSAALLSGKFMHTTELYLDNQTDNVIASKSYAGMPYNPNAPNITVAATIDLSAVVDQLEANGTISSTDPDVVLPFLTANLKWRHFLNNGSQIADNAPAFYFEIQIHQSTIQPTTSSDSFPVTLNTTQVTDLAASQSSAPAVAPKTGTVVNNNNDNNNSTNIPTKTPTLGRLILAGVQGKRRVVL